LTNSRIEGKLPTPSDLSKKGNVHHADGGGDVRARDERDRLDRWIGRGL
jgi:hypothetical protein